MKDAFDFPGKIPRREAVRRLLAGGVMGLAPGRLYPDEANPFFRRLHPAPVGGGFSLPGYWIWCGSVIRGEDNRFHMFASRWPGSLSFFGHWLLNSEVVRASAARPEGPYQFEEVVLPARDGGFWDGRMTHNPTIHKHKDTYLLFYTGTTYDGPMPTPENPEVWGSPKNRQARQNQRIGLATARSVRGPWIRSDKPVLEPRPGKWDGLMTTNAAPCVRAGGRILLGYKSSANQKDLLRMGVATAPHFSQPFRRLSEEPIFNFDQTGDHVEDGYIWWENNRYNMVMKDMRGGISGEKGGGILASSRDGVRWETARPAKAYSRTIRWDNGETTVQGQLERPQLLIQDGRPTHIFFATGNGGGGYDHMTKSWSMVIPLK